MGARSFPGNPYDGHTLESQLEQVAILTSVQPKRVFADRGYRGAEVPQGTSLYLSGQKRLTPSLKRLLKRRNSVEPVIGHLKEDGLMRRNWLKGSIGDALHAVLCGAGHNIRILLRKIRLFYPEIWARFCRLLEAALQLVTLKSGITAGGLSYNA